MVQKQQRAEPKLPFDEALKGEQIEKLLSPLQQHMYDVCKQLLSKRIAFSSNRVKIAKELL
jgi:hypothetical protein